MMHTRVRIPPVNARPCPCAQDGHWRCVKCVDYTGVLEYNIYIYTCPLFRARRATRTFVNLYLFSRIVSQVLLIRHRSHFFAGTAFRGLRRAPAATTHPSQRGAFIFNINRGFSSYRSVHRHGNLCNYNKHRSESLEDFLLSLSDSLNGIIRYEMCECWGILKDQIFPCLRGENIIYIRFIITLLFSYAEYFI